MNYAQARQRESDKRWDWTTMNDGRVWRSAPCTDHDDGHATAEEAERHFWESEVSDGWRVEQMAGTQRECAICGAWTQDLVRLHDGYTSFVLCPDHQDRASIETVHPFSTGRQLMHS